jgi:hypothetical protein
VPAIETARNRPSAGWKRTRQGSQPAPPLAAHAQPSPTPVWMLWRTATDDRGACALLSQRVGVRQSAAGKEVTPAPKPRQASETQSASDSSQTATNRKSERRVAGDAQVPAGNRRPQQDAGFR